jgi:hypothetical protein
MKNLFLCLLIFLYACAPTFRENKSDVAVITERHYVPASSGSGLGYGMTPSGQLGYGVIMTSNPACYHVFFKSDKSGTFIIDDKKLYEKYNIGDTVHYQYKEIRRPTGKRKNGEPVYRTDIGSWTRIIHGKTYLLE